MKDVTKIVVSMKKVCEVVEGMDSIITVKEGIDLLAKFLLETDSKKAQFFFKKYGVYEADYIKEQYPSLYPVLEDVLKELAIKEVKKARRYKGVAEEVIKEELERTQLIESLEGQRVFGYARVSTKDQNLDRQIIALEEAGCQVIFQEKQSGKDTNRVEFKALMNVVREGDTIIISDLTRLARSTADLAIIVEELGQKGVSLKSLKEKWVDTTTAHGRMIFTFFSGIAQFEREVLLERQAEGIKVAKENGVKFGRKLDKDADIELAINLVKEGNYTLEQIAKMCNISRTTLWRKCKAMGILR